MRSATWRHFPPLALSVCFAILAAIQPLRAVPALTWQDIGSPSPAGSHSYDAGTDTYTIIAGGEDMWGTIDRFRFGYESASGDGDLVAKVDSIAGPSGWSRTGVSFRASTAVDAAHVTLIATVGNGVDLQWRATTGGSTSHWSSQPGVNPAPVFLKLVRSGNDFSAYRSPDGVTWTFLTSTNVTLPANALAGIIACAVNLFTPTQSITAVVSGYTSTFSVPTRVISLSGDLAFGDVTVGSSVERILIISNSGNTALNVASLTLPPGFSGAFAGAIAPGNSEEVAITFTPASVSAYGGTITVNADHTAGTNTIACSGSGIATPTGLIWEDIGAPAVAGSQTYDAALSRYTIQAGGEDMWFATDRFRFGHAEFTGNVELVMRVQSITGPHNWSRVGLTFRSSLTSDAAHVSLIATNNNGVDLQWRSVVGGQTSNDSGQFGQNPAPEYLKLVRNGDTFSGYRSEDGTNWTLVRTQTVDLPDTVQVGIIACAVSATLSMNAVIDVGQLEETLFGPPPATVVLSNLSHTYDGTPKSATATTTPPGLSVTITYDGSTTPPTNAGSYAVVATIVDPVYTGSANGTLVIDPAAQTITFPAIADVHGSFAPIPLTATASSGLPVMYSVFAGPAQIVGGVLTPTGIGTVTIRASQPGNTNFAAATPVDRTFEVFPARILCIGDSFTQGGLGIPGYRDPFIRLLRGEIINGANPLAFDYWPLIDMIGNQTTAYLDDPPASNYPTSIALDPDNEGHSGWTADHILDGNPDEPLVGKLSDWLAGYPDLPDIVLLHIGTNDALHQRGEDNFDTGTFFGANIRSEIGGIIDAVHAANPAAEVFVAKIPPANFWPFFDGNQWRAATNVVNALIDGIVAEKNTAAGSTFVRVVDNFSAFDSAAMLEPDGLHPNAAGRDFIAANFFNAIQWLLDGDPAPPVPPPYSGPLRVLCLGDSITQGGGGSVHAGWVGQTSYRYPLQRLLSGENINDANPTAKTYDLRFIGTMSTTWDYSPGTEELPAPLASQPWNEGHGVWTAGEIIDGDPESPVNEGAGSLPDWLIGYTPDIVLLHIGSWDARFQWDQPISFAETTRDNIGRIIDALRADNPDVVVFLAKLAQGASWWNGAIDAVNAHIDALAAAKNAAAAEPFVFVVDQNTGFDPSSMLADEIHPNAAGDAFMAVNWFTALSTYLDSLSFTPIQAWRQTHFGSPDDAGDGADENDFDGDGLPNILEYALGLDPLVPNSSPAVTAIVGDYLTVTVAKNPAATDVEFSAESGATPGALSPANTVGLINTTTTFSARDNVLISTATARFIRVRVTRN